MATDLFEREGTATVYEKMRPDQRTAIGEEFMRVLRLTGDALAPSFPLDINGTLSTEQVSNLHAYAREHHRELFMEVMQHPVTLGALTSMVAPDTPTDTTIGRPADGAADKPRLWPFKLSRG
jgi:hypothetical protein